MGQARSVTIHFSSITNLWTFRQAIDCHIFEMSLITRSITCECTEEQIKLALEQFGGELYQMENTVITL